MTHRYSSITAPFLLLTVTLAARADALATWTINSALASAPST